MVEKTYPSSQKEGEKNPLPNTPKINSGVLKSNKKKAQKQSGIPKAVANRMARRIAFTTGLSS